jgi:transcriptional repressor NrdR
MEELRHLDEVAFVRFASVYRHFQDVEAFRDEIERLRHHRRKREAREEQLSFLPATDQPPKPVPAVDADAKKKKDK